MWIASRAESRARFCAISPARCRRYGFAPVDRRVTVQNLLQDFRIRHQSLTRRNQPLQEDLSFRFLWMGSAEEVHRYVGIHKGHLSYPLSISASI